MGKERWGDHSKQRIATAFLDDPVNYYIGLSLSDETGKVVSVGEIVTIMQESAESIKGGPVADNTTFGLYHRVLDAVCELERFGLLGQEHASTVGTDIHIRYRLTEMGRLFFDASAQLVETPSL